MSPLLLIAIVFVLLTIIGVPLFVSVGASTLLALYLIDIPYTLMAQTGYSSLTPFPLLTIPLFVLSGRLMEVGGMANRMISIATKLVGAYRGSMGLVTVFACMLFAALSGSSPATVVAIGTIVIGGMIQVGYSKEFAAGVICNAGTLGILIPPSIVMVVYAASVEVSVGRMFLAGVIPGLLAGLMLMTAIYVMAKIKNLPKEDSELAKEKK